MHKVLVSRSNVSGVRKEDKMIFCGQCGLQLAPGSTRCPRCGATVEAGSANSMAGHDVHTDDATVASPSLIVRNPSGSSKPNQQPLVLRPASEPNNYDYGTAAAQGATSRVDAANFPAGIPTNQNVGASYPGYTPQQQGGVFPTQASYPGYGVQQSGGNYPTQLAGGYPGQYEQQTASTHAKGRAAAIVVIIFGLLFILAAVILFIIQQNSLSGTGYLYHSAHIAMAQLSQ